MRRFKATAVAALAAAALFALPKTADAALEACGNIHIEAGAQCEIIPPGTECQVHCTPLSVRAACAAELYLECDGQCDASASVECTADCDASCRAECDADPGSFDCRGACQADCEGACSARCSSGDDDCFAQCQATCSAECDAECSVVPPEADCEAQCDACCAGSCTAEANIDCQLDCQGDAFGTCEVELQGECTADCQSTQGALFCDDAYVHYDDLQACVEALRDLEIRVEGSVEVEASGSASCSAAGGAGAGMSALFVAFASLFALRRRRV